MTYETEPATPVDYSDSPDYWTAYLATIVAAYLRCQVDEYDLFAALAAFVGSPACGEALRRVLLDDE